MAMAKILKCGDLNPGCSFEAQGNNEDEVLRAAAEHARTKHGMTSIPPEMMSKVRSLIQDQDTSSRKIAP
jgi:predicted small metal-binding protein